MARRSNPKAGAKPAAADQALRASGKDTSDLPNQDTAKSATADFVVDQASRDRPPETAGADGAASSAPADPPSASAEASADTSPEATAGKPVTPGLRIAARRDGFRRAGMAHTKEPIVHAPEVVRGLSREQLIALLEETMLTTVELVLPSGEVIPREQMLAELKSASEDAAKS